MQKQTSNQSDIMRYSGLGVQLVVALGLSVFAGYKADKWVKISFPLFVWLLPLAVLAGMMYKLVKDNSKKEE